jgi:hypothetical protein
LELRGHACGIGQSNVGRHVRDLLLGLHGVQDLASSKIKQKDPISVFRAISVLGNRNISFPLVFSQPICFGILENKRN